VIRTLALVLVTGCLGSDPSLGDAHWNATPPDGVPSDTFTLAWAEHTATGFTVHTISNDEETHCSEARHVGAAGLTVVLTEAAGSTIGQVGVGAAAPAQITLGNRVYTAGTLDVTSVEDAIRATFDATTVGTSLTGGFSATLCN